MHICFQSEYFQSEVMHGNHTLEINFRYRINGQAFDCNKEQENEHLKLGNQTMES